MVKCYYYCFLLFLVSALADTVTIGGMFETFSTDSAVNYQQSQYLAAFLFAIDEINNKSDGIMDDLLPNTTLHVIVRAACESGDVARRAVHMIEKDSVRGEVGVDAVVSTLESGSNNDVYLSEVFTSTKTPHLLTRQMHPDMHLNVISHHPFNVNIAPDVVLQMYIWQSTLCQYGYRAISLFYLDSLFGAESLSALTDGYYCTIILASTHAIAPGQVDFREEIAEAYDALSIIQILILDLDTAVPFLQQAHQYGLIRQNHQLIVNSELLTTELWQRMSPNADVVSILRGAFGVKYSPKYGLDFTDTGQSFQQRFRNRPSTLIDGVCDTSVDDSDGTHYLYRNEDGSLCAGLNHSSFVSASDFAPKVGLVYDGVIALALGLHEVVYNRSLTVSNDVLIDSLNSVTFSGVSGEFSLHKDINRGGLLRSRGYHYDMMGFNQASYESGGDGFVNVGSWDDVNFVLPCGYSKAPCVKHEHNTPDGKLPKHHPRYIDKTLPEILKIGVMINTFNEDGSVNAAGVQQLAAFLMAVREINNKTDGVADDLLPNTKIVIGMRSSYSQVEAYGQVMKMAFEDFGSGVDAIISARDMYETIIAYHLQNSVPILVSHTTLSDYLLDNELLAPRKLQTGHSAAMYGTALQSLVCDQFEYRNIAVFVSKGTRFTQAYTEFVSRQYCEFSILSHIELDHNADVDRAVNEAKRSGARVFVLFTDAAQNKNLVLRGYDRGLFGRDRQVFAHADAISSDLFEENGDEVLHGFVVVKEAPNAAFTHTREGKDFVGRWREQASTIGNLIDGGQACLNDRDDNDYFYLYQSAPSFDSSHTCSGLDFTLFSSNGQDIESYVPHSYDTIMMFARGYHKHIYDYNASVIDPLDVYDTILSEVQFDGASGWFDLNDGSKVTAQRGSRRRGQYYNVYNYVKSGVHAIAQGNGTFLRPPGKYLIGTWEATAGYASCNASTSSCKLPYFNTQEGEMAAETRPSISLRPSQIGLRVASVILAALATMFLLLYVIRRHYTIIGQAYCGMLPVISIGAYLFAARLWLTSITPTDDICAGRMIGLHGCFVTFWGPIAMSSFRSYRLKYESSHETKYNVSNIKLAQLGLSLGAIGYCAIIGFGLRYFRKMEYEEATDNRTETMLYCAFTDNMFSNIIIFVESVMLLRGLHGAYRARNILDHIGETKTSFVVLSIFVLYLTIAYPMWAGLNLTPDQNVILVEFNLGGLHILCLGMLLFHKLYMLQVVAQGSDVSLHATCYGDSDSAQYSAESVRSLMDAMTHDSKVKLCRRQVNEWMVLLMSIDFTLLASPYAMSAPKTPLWSNAQSKNCGATLIHQLVLDDIPEAEVEW